MKSFILKYSHNHILYLTGRKLDRKRTRRKKGRGETCSSYPQAVLHHKKMIKKQTERARPKPAWKKNRYSMLFNIWKTCWLSAQILPRGCWAWVRNSVAVRLTVRSLSGANTLFIRLSVCLFIWLSNYPSQQTPHHEPNVNTIVSVGHMSQLVGLLPEYHSQTTSKGSMLGCSYNSPFVSKCWENLLFCLWFVDWITYFWTNVQRRYTV